jgi:YVTN family beta-propeller protein
VLSNIKMTAVDGAPTVPRPMGAALSPDGRQLFVTNGRATTVSVIDVAGRAVTRTVTGAGTRPWGIDITPDGTKLFTANGPSGNVSVIDVASGNVEQHIETGGSPWGVSILNER